MYSKFEKVSSGTWYLVIRMVCKNLFNHETPVPVRPLVWMDIMGVEVRPDLQRMLHYYSLNVTDVPEPPGSQKPWGHIEDSDVLVKHRCINVHSDHFRCDDHLKRIILGFVESFWNTRRRLWLILDLWTLKVRVKLIYFLSGSSEMCGPVHAAGVRSLIRPVRTACFCSERTNRALNQELRHLSLRRSSSTPHLLHSVHWYSL